MERPPLIVIFGAWLAPDGTPSAALSRRIASGLAAAQVWPEAQILLSGGGRGARPEADVMAERLLAAGVAPRRLIRDRESRDTLENVLAAARVARDGGHRLLVACSDGYHLPRILLLLAILGVRAASGPGRGGPPVAVLLGMAAREAVAIPYDAAILIWRRLSGADRGQG